MSKTLKVGTLIRFISVESKWEDVYKDDVGKIFHIDYPNGNYELTLGNTINRPGRHNCEGKLPTNSGLCIGFDEMDEILEDGRAVIAKAKWKEVLSYANLYKPE